MAKLLGVDTGGTYTDAVIFDDKTGTVIARAKALTTHRDLAEGVGEAMDAAIADAGVSPAEIALASMSTTLATNALVEGHGDAAGLVMIGFDEADLGRAGLGAGAEGDRSQSRSPDLLGRELALGPFAARMLSGRRLGFGLAHPRRRGLLAKANATQPTRNRSPPTGVIAPSQVRPLRTSA